MSQEFMHTSNITTETPPEGVRIIDVPVPMPPIEDESGLSASVEHHTAEIARQPEFIDTEFPDEVDERVPDEIRHSFVEHDKVIHSRFNAASTQVQRAVDEITSDVRVLKQESEHAIERTRESVILKNAEDAKERDAIIAAAHERYALKTGKRIMRAEGYITEQSRVIDAADAFIDETKRVASQIENGIKTAVSLEAVHEKTRDDAATAIDTLSDRRTVLINEIQASTTLVIAKVQERIGIERSRALLLDEEDGLRLQKDQARTNALKPYVQHFTEKLHMEAGSDVFNNAIAEIEAKNVFAGVKEASDKLATYPEKFINNKEKKDKVSDEISELYTKIGRDRTELDQIPDKITEAKAIVTNEAVVVSRVQESYSADAVALAGVFTHEVTGDVNIVNAAPIPSGLVNLRGLKLDVSKAVRAVDKDDPFEGIEAPLISPELETLLHLTPESRDALIEGVGRAQMKQVTDSTIEMVKRGTGSDIRGAVYDVGAKIGGFALLGIRKPGKNIRYMKVTEAKE